MTQRTELFAAALQAAQGSDSPILLSIDRQTGHGGTGRIAPKARNWTDSYALLMSLFDMTPGSMQPID